MNLTRIFGISGALLAAALSFGQAVRADSKADGYGQDVFHGPYFDSSTKTTFWAKIKGISETPSHKAGQATDIALLVLPFSIGHNKAGEIVYNYGDYLNVELGPQWYVKSQDTKLHVNDYVQITGSRMRLGKDPVVIAQMVRRNHNILALRRSSGEPYWYFYRQDAVAVSQPPTDQGTTIQEEDMPPPDYVQEPPTVQSGMIQVGNGVYLQTYNSTWGPAFIINPVRYARY